MIRWTTPDLRWRFRKINVADIAVCKLYVMQGNVEIDKTLSDAMIGEKEIVFRLSQQETARLEENKTAEIQIHYKLTDGTVGGSKIYKVQVDRILKEGAI